MWIKSSFAAIALLLLPVAARAEQRPFVVSHDATTLAPGDVEMETWLDRLFNRRVNDEWVWWLGPRWAPVDGFELMMLTALTQEVTPAKDGGSTTQLWAELVEARWRAVSLGVAGDLMLQLDARIGLANDLPHQVQPSLGWAVRVGRVILAAQSGYAKGFGGPAGKRGYDWIVWRGGASCDVGPRETSRFQVGVEGFGEGVLTGVSDLSGAGSTANVGPTISVARGRLWLTIGALFGLTEGSPQMFTRGVIGVAL